MAVMTLSNHVLTSSAQGDTFGDWVCIDEIEFEPTAGGDILEINDSAGKAVLEPYIAPDANVQRIRMHGKWAKGLNIVDMDGISSNVKIYLRQV